MRNRSLSLLVVLALGAGTAAAALPEKQLAKTLPLVSGKLTVETFKGSIRLHAWDRAEVAVKARVVADDSCTRGEQQEKVDKTEVVVEQTSAGVSVRADYDRVPQHHFFWFGCSALPFVHLDISLPKTADVRVKDFKSEIRAEGLQGNLRLDTYKGRVELEDLGGALDLTTFKGTVHASTALRKDTRVETFKGDVTLRIPKGTAFTLDADLGRRARLESDFENARGARRESVHGGGPLLKLKSHKGDLRLREG